MRRKTAAAIAALNLLAVLAAAGMATARILIADVRGRQVAQEDAARLAAILAPVRSASDLGETGLRTRLREFYARSPVLLLAAVYERGLGVRWRIPARSDYLPAEEDLSPLPSPRYPPRSAILIRNPLSGDPSGRMALDALYVTLPQSVAFEAIRDSTVGLSAWLLLLFSLLLISRILSVSGREARWRPTGPATPGSGTYGAAIPAEPRSHAEPVEPFQPADRLAEEDRFEVPAVSLDLGADGENASFDTDIPDLPRPEVLRGEQSPSDRAHQPVAATAEPRGLYSPRSGLGWEEYLPDRLSAELARAASFEQDLALVAIALDSPGEEEELYTTTSRSVREFWGFRDLAFEREAFGFAVVLPNMDLEHSLRKAEEFLKKLTFLLGSRRAPLEYLPVFIGISTRAGRLVDAVRLVQEADAALEKAREERDSHIMAFKPDPDKFRLFLASTGQG